MQRTQNRALVKNHFCTCCSRLCFCTGCDRFWHFMVLGKCIRFPIRSYWFCRIRWFYSLWTKRTTIHQTLVGSISGAAPPMIGYTAVASQFDLGAF